MKRLSTLLWLLAVLKLNSAQDRVIFRDDEVEASTSLPRQIPMRIPEKLLIQLKDVRNRTDLLQRFVVPDRNVIRDNTTVPLISGRTPLSSAPSMDSGVHGYCQPIQSIVELETPGNGPTYLFPSCIRVRRCGGCCTSKLLTCTPVKISSIVVMVTQLIYNYNPEFPDAFEEHSIRSFTLEQHDQCVCKCLVQPEDCGSLQEYREDECQCICRNQHQVSQCTGSKRVWDNSECACKCRQVLDCSTGFHFHTRKCRCERIRSNRAGTLETRNVTPSLRSMSLNLNATESNVTHLASTNT